MAAAEWRFMRSQEFGQEAKKETKRNYLSENLTICWPISILKSVLN